ncbi:MAG TPA: helix-hairpin-helix domain-containing protein [Bacteroidia bacterium]
MMLILSALLYFTNELKFEQSMDVNELIAKINLLESEKSKQSLHHSVIPDSIRLFDPNKIGEDLLIKYGLKKHLAKRIISFRNSGAKFKFKSDILKIYGMDTTWFDKVLPWIDLPLKTSSNHLEKFDRKYRIEHLIEINTADTNALKSLPGIASKLALRIINFRDKLGGFYSLSQLSQVYGLRPETITLILPRLKIDSTLIKTIDINSVDVSSLSQHPYCGFKHSRALINYRNQHGKFGSCEDLKSIITFTQDNIQQFCHYLRFN